MSLGDPADKLDAQADGAFQSRGTRFEDLDEMVMWMLKGYHLTSAEIAKIGDEFVRQRKKLHRFGVYER